MIPNKKNASDEDIDKLINWIWAEFDTRFLKVFNAFKSLLEDGWSPGDVMMLLSFIEMVMNTADSDSLEAVGYDNLKTSQLVCMLACLAKRKAYVKVEPNPEDASQARIVFDDLPPESVTEVRNAVVTLADALERKLKERGMTVTKEDLEHIFKFSTTKAGDC